MAQLLDRLPLTAQDPGSIPGRDTSYELSLLVRSLLLRVFIRVLLFSSLLKKRTGGSSDYLQNSQGRGSEREIIMSPISAR